jgi:GNAT superfamily N-acetyltransferase
MQAGVADLVIREAVRDDLPAIVALFEADPLGGHGDRWCEETRPAYEAAFAAVTASADNRLYVAVLAGRVIGTFQLTFIPGLTGRGARRAKLAAVQVEAGLRSRGIGTALVAFAEDAARAAGAASLELTSNKRRLDAHRFYERHGYARSHEGFKKLIG